MKIDSIAFYFEYENSCTDICFGGKGICKYNWLCGTRLIDEWTQSYYTEGENPNE